MPRRRGHRIHRKSLIKSKVTILSSIQKWRDLTLASAGILQACALVEQLARTGYVPTDAYACCIKSLYDLNPKNTQAVYGDISDLRLGVETLNTFLQSSKELQSNTIRYSAGILHLQKRLVKRENMLSSLTKRIEQAANQAKHFNATHENVIGNLAGIYSDTISTFQFRIQVEGDRDYLEQQRIANQIRALLLAAIRSAILWRQLGGSRLHLLFHRKKMQEGVDILLKEMSH